MNIKRDKKDIRKSQKIMFCENCGAELQDPNQPFCLNCGTPSKAKAEIQLDSKETLICLDSHARKIWIWQGNNTTVRKKFIAREKAKVIREKYGIGYKIEEFKEGSESLEFKTMIGLKENSLSLLKQPSSFLNDVMGTFNCFQDNKPNLRMFK